MHTRRCGSTALVVAWVGLLMLCGAAMAVAALEAYGVVPTQKILREEAPAATWQAGKIALECARNESEAFQVVVRGAEAASDFTVVPTDLRSEAGDVLPAADLRIARVEWVDINAPFEPDKPSQHPDFRPDPLPPVNPATDRLRLEPGRNLVLWVCVRVPADARPGRYQGQIALTSAGAPQVSVAITLRVRSFALPQRPILQSMIGLAEGNIYAAHGCKTPEDKERVIRLYFDEYIRARLSPFLYAPGTMAFNPLPNGRIGWEFVTGPDGKPTGEAKLDFTVFDREGEVYFNQRQAFSAFNFAPYLWSRRKREDGKTQVVLRFADVKGIAVERLNADGTVNPVFDRLVVAVFRQIAAHLAERGWLDRAIYYVTDEPGEGDVDELKQVCRLVREADPRIRTSLTYDPANRPRLAELVADGKSLISVWIPYYTLYREDVAAEQRKKGADYWLYDVSSTCLISHSGEVNRALFWDIWRYDTHGYLYYLSTWWGRSVTPWERPNFMLPGITYKYHHGDGYFFYPPLRTGTPDKPILDHVVPTIRWELMREGAEDYDTLRMLEALTARAKARGIAVAARGDEALARARSLAEAISAKATGYGIRDLQFTAHPEKAGAIPGTGWSFNADEGWLHHRGGQRADLPIRVRTGLPDGRYELVLNVYSDSAYRGRPYSRFLVNGKPYATPPSDIGGPVDVVTETVEVAGGECAFTLSAVPEEQGVIVYRAGLKAVPQGASRDLYAVRGVVADAIEALSEALGTG